ncbi:MAG: hypothetical protein K9W43_01400 [Candidatus Thorarchaeota archaeon]|nr:hypothetical protein [Candidatus Thorarchaeota archaeon]
MSESLVGTITSRDIAVLGDLKYGFIGVETDNHHRLKVKISAHTHWDDLNVGDRVRVVGTLLQKDRIFTAEEVSKIS